ncbi:SusD/RagB family nutrient-binding outer membrane lipoprotein [Marinilabilia rubra]|uniref:SusD/RagB family nutrient-binding outer membrane lipoprotein n=1 Tax=Marinilabilia rubra TaxID=2162893 RepID=A0A2U2BDF2_9BACT|nr:SusD/RagB family nutrient-binding outer membrane lipoprotein [Marinilabilia rubra]PWE01091.1 SusD/RagB family nutrient-binding outer membrane lipoprotein [Marinilabilia rubra]
MKLKYFLSIFIFMVIIVGCTDKFEKINTRPDVFYSDEVSGKFFLTNPQYRLFAPDRFPYWRAHLIHADRYAGHFTFGHNSSWWSDELGYSYSAGYTDAAWGWLEGYLGGLDNFMKLTENGGEFENEHMYAMGLIMKGLYYQMFTDVFGMIPYSQAADPDIVTPEFDSQKVIYKGIIADLEEAMSIIGDAERTGVGVDDVGDNDLYYNGDLQKWKKLANTLKLRIALRAYGAEGDDFSETAINEALSAPLLATVDDNCLMEKDAEISQWGSAAYGDVWHSFGAGSDWTVSKPLVDYLRNEDDPRLSKYVKPAEGGTAKFVKPEGSEGDLFLDRVNFILDELNQAGVSYDREDIADTVTVNVAPATYYVGQPVRINSNTYPYVEYDFFSTPADIVIQQKNQGEDIFPEIVLQTAESYFLQAEAAVRGLGSGDANFLYQEGIRQAMAVWEISSAQADTYIANSELGSLTGSVDEQLEKIAIQRWIAAYTDGFEAWAVVRDFGYPSSLADGVSDPDIYGLGDINGRYPQRMRYGNDAWNKNGANTQAAVDIQGPDVQDTKLWWAK